MEMCIRDSVYTVKEVDVPAGYIVSYVKKNASGTTVTAEDAGENGVFEVRNSYTTQKGDIEVEKKWVGDNQMCIRDRPDAACFCL